MDWQSLTLVTIAVLFIGIAKAGFGGGLGMLTTPLTVLAFSQIGKAPPFAIGTLLPLLCAGDAFSLWHYWGRWRKDNLKYLLPGTVVGIIIGVQLIDRFTPRGVNIAIGIIAVLFVVFQLTKEKILRREGTFQPTHVIGIPTGLGIGITSSFAHGAGPVAALFLFPQRLPKETYVATNILVFTCVNWLKMPFFMIDQSMIPLPLFAKHAIINAETLWMGLKLFPLVPVGVWIGVWLNQRFSESGFVKFVLAALFLTGLQLIFNVDFAALFR
jgi:uncharacterized membrane protein YfcA